MTTPSSTSQSILVEPRGFSTVSLGPTMQLVAFMNTMGSARDLRAGFGGVIRVVEPDGDELADAADAGAEARAGGSLR